MAEIILKVDTALGEFPVNIFPLIDDTDFKSREVSIAYNATGMDLVWNFVDTSGNMTQTAVTPTTSGTYDWAHIGDGMYTIEIPASGGASINNDTEGFGWFTGICTGVLPWRSPIAQFTPAIVVDSLVNGSDALQVDTIQLSGDVTAADNAESFFDGTGYAGTNNVIPTVTTLTGHTAQTGDSYAIVNNGTYGNSALETLVDDVESALTNATYGLNALLTAINSRLATTGYTAPPTVGQIADAVCDEALSGHSAPGTVGISITDTLGYVTALRSALTDLRAAALDRIVGTLATGTHEPQSGDSFARLGSPVGASISADITTIDTVVDAVKVKTDALPSGIKKGVAITNFVFLMKSSTDHVSGATGLTVTGQIKKDAGSFGAITGTITEVAYGLYTVDTISTSEMNADMITLRFSSAGADDSIMEIKTV